MLLMAPISGLTVKNSRFSLDPTIAYIHQHLFKIYYFQFEHCYDISQNIHNPYSCICLCSLFLQPKYTAVGSFSWHYFPSSSLLCIILFSVSQNIHNPYSCICLCSLFLQPKYTAVGSFSWHYFPSSSLLCIILFSVSILL